MFGLQIKNKILSLQKISPCLGNKTNWKEWKPFTAPIPI